jgi:spore photoproduct lyase
MVTELDFFKGKRPWSKIKDQVIGSYLVPYFRKVSKLGHKIIIVDAFAGQGIFDDGSRGSPLIICEVAEKHIPGKYLGIFVNKDKESHLKLEKALKKYIDSKKAITIKGNAQDLLRELTSVAGDATLLIYLDPFGLKGCEFKILELHLGRDKRFSTEIIINMSMPTLHRLSAFRAVKENRVTPRIKKLNQRLTDILGGEYWKSIMWSDLTAEEKEKKVVEKYVGLLKQYLPFVGFCPVREKRGSRTKYYIIFCSRHQDALILMNDIMCNAYFKTMHEIEYKGTLFEGTLDWKRMSQRGDIREVIKAEIKKSLGISREELWLEIIKSNFMRWLRTEYREAVKQMIKNQEITTKGHTLNDQCPLYLNENPFSISTTVNVPLPKVTIHRKPYKMLDGREKLLVERVNDGSIIKRFDKTPYPQKPTDVVCPHFLELKWAYGCPYDCAWCYLKGTFRFRPEGTKPAFKPLDKIKTHIEAFLEKERTPEILNTGEIADSLMGERGDCPFSKFIISIFEEQKRHKVLFVTKSSNIKNLLMLPSCHQLVISFSLNADLVARKWELGAPSIENRLKAAKELYEKDFVIRLRIDPLVPIKNWRVHYFRLIDNIFNHLVPERITLGSLRGLQSTINGTKGKDQSWTVFLKENSNWGKKVEFKVRWEMYKALIQYIKYKYKYSRIALCKETKAMWARLNLDWKDIKCNCIL